MEVFAADIYGEVDGLYVFDKREARDHFAARMEEHGYMVTSTDEPILTAADIGPLLDAAAG